MNWFRSRIRACARLALFSLAFQMAVSFGHMHRDDLGLPESNQIGAGAGAQVEAVKAGAATAPITAVSVAAHAPAQPASPARHPASNDYCPICADMALIATAIPSLPPLLIVPASVHRIWFTQALAPSVSRPVTQSFQARAPPLA